MESLRTECQKLGLDLTDRMVEQFKIYAEFLIEYNEKVNLTAITQWEEVKMKHFLDSLLLLSVYAPPLETTVVDIGTGAGFPGLPMKILRPDLRVTLLDSLNKRLLFLEELVEKLDLSVKLVHGRAEQVGQESPFREGYELVVSRAVTNLPALAEYALPIVEEGGLFIAYKGPEWEEDYNKARKGIKLLGGKMEKVEQLLLPDGSERNLLFIRKVKETPAKYPRRGVRIAKNPL